MRLPLRAYLGAALAAVVVVAAGCSDVTQLSPEELLEARTLTVAFSDDQRETRCDDALPILDGIAQELEWGRAEPLFLQMTGGNGNGGADYVLELRAVWSNNVPGFVYFLVRYADNDLDAEADQLVYGTINPVTGEVIKSPQPNRCDPDSVLLQPENWTRINKDGREDQVFLTLTEVMNGSDDAGLIDFNGELLSKAGPSVPADGIALLSSVPNPTDVWAWRAGRTNRHPINQYVDQDGRVDEETGIPVPESGEFQFQCGYCEDLNVSFGRIRHDEDGDGNRNTVGSPFRWNVDPVFGPAPDRLHQCPPAGRDPDAEELNFNGGIPADLGLWYPTSHNFTNCDSVACSRLGQVNVWSRGLPDDRYDTVQGWALTIPQGSGSDVRAFGVHSANAEKAFFTWTIEMMRLLDTGNDDDVDIDPADPTREYRLVVGVLDASGRVGSGSEEVRLVFEAPYTQNQDLNRCQ